MAIDTYTQSGGKAATAVKLDKTIFGLKVNNHELIKAAYLAYMANGRPNLAKTKSRGEVSGGGKKPWRQKGTGRARFGSSRNPIWRGGGVAFGPTGSENFTRRISTSAKRQAIKQALSLAAEAGKISIIENFDVKSGKTKDAETLLAKLNADRNVLVVVPQKTTELSRAVSNIGYVKLVQPSYVNVFDVMNASTIIISQNSLSELSQWLTQSSNTDKKAE